MAKPGDELATPPGGRGHLRASHADREQVIYTLKVAFVQGMLDKDDFDLRVGQTFASRTYAELAAVVADIPAELRTARAPESSPAARDQPVARPGPVLGAATAVYGGLWAYVLLLSPHGGDNHSTPPLIFGGGIVYLGVLLICVAAAAAMRRERRSGGQPPQRPAASAGETAFPDQGRRLPPDRDGHTFSTRTARGRGSRPTLPVRGHSGDRTRTLRTAAAG
jgi:Domain of unknown function (DUF1707)